jgi:glycosyltransferase involved in cell wall biosynthesis
VNAIRPLISVVVPVFNGAPYLSQAIDSILRQNYEPVEIIVVDDGSTDDSAAIVRGFGPAVTYCWQPQRGAAAARNHGVARARGEALAFLDADDLWMPDKLAIQSVYLHRHPEVGAVLGFVEQFISPELDEEARGRLLCPSDPMPGYQIGALLVRRAAFDRVGPFDVSYIIAHFIDWWSRATGQGMTHCLLPAVVLRRRVHTNNLTLRRSDARREYARLARAALERRRASQASSKATGH